MPRITQSVRFQLFAALGLVIALWAAIAYALHSAQREAIERANTEGRNLARGLAAHVAASVRTIDISLQYLRSEWNDGPKDFAAALEAQQTMLKEALVFNVIVTDADGWSVYSTAPDAPSRVFLGDRKYFKAVKERAQDELYISEPVSSRFTDKWVIVFARPLHDGRRKFRGILLLSVLPPQLERVYDDIRLGEGSSISLVRSDGQFLARSSNLSRSVGIPIAPVPGHGLMPDDPVAGDFRTRTVVEGIDSMFSYRRVPGYPLIVYVRQPMDAVLASYSEQRRNYLVFGVLATVLLLALSMLLISRRRDRENAERNRARLSAIVEGTGDAIVSVDLDSKIESWNAGAERLFGYTAAEAIGRNSGTLIVPPDFMEQFRTARERIARGESVQPFDAVRVAKDGRRIDVSVSLAPVKDARGRVIGRSAILQNIAVRKRMEEALREQTEWLRLGQSTARMIVMDWDIVRDQLSWSDSAEWLRGPLPEGGGYPLYKDQVHAEDRERFLEMRAKAIETLQGQTMDYRIVRTDGKVLWLHSRQLVVAEAGGRAARMLVALLDITERKRAEEQIRTLNAELERRVDERTAELRAAVDALQGEVRERQRAEAAALGLADRLRGMAHRLGEAQELERRRLAAELHDGVCSNLAAVGLNIVLLQKQLLQTDAGMASRLSGLITLIDEAQANAKDISVDLRPLLLEDRDLIPALEDYGRKFGAGTGIAVRVTAAGSGRRLPAEEKIALFRITQEALTNCAKHARAKAVGIEFNTDADHWLLSIADDGVGADLAGISRSETGLGLLSMQERAEAIGADWRIESAPGKGTRVIVRGGGRIGRPPE
jgi:PAS domain S-box-containing protein